MMHDEEGGYERLIKRKERTSEQQKIYRANNKEDRKEKRKKYLEENKEYVATVCKAYRLRNRDKIREKQKVYDKERRAKPEVKEKNRISNKEYREKNKDTLRVKQNLYYLNRRQNDPLYHLTWILRVRIRDAFRRNGYKKTSKTCELLGADFKTVSKYIEQQFTEGMVWGLVGPKIHIDHKIPLASANNKEELIKLFHYTNLQPLWAEDNLKKSNKVLTF